MDDYQIDDAAISNMVSMLQGGSSEPPSVTPSSEPPEPTQPVVNPDPPDETNEQKARRYAKKYNVPENLAVALMAQESKGKTKAHSWKGAGGPMQLMPDTARKLGVTDIYDPDQNIKAGVQYLSSILDKYGRTDEGIKKSIAGYNLGPDHKILSSKDWYNQLQYASNDPEVQAGRKPRGASDRTNTQNYVKNIYSNYKSGGGGGTVMNYDISDEDIKRFAGMLPTSGKPMMDPKDVTVDPDAIPDEDIKRFASTVSDYIPDQHIKAIADIAKSVPDSAVTELGDIRAAAKAGAKYGEPTKAATEQDAQRAVQTKRKVQVAQSALRTNPQPDFVSKGGLTIPAAVGQPEEKLTYDPVQQTGLTKGEYRLSDPDGTTYIYNPSTGGFVDEADSTVLKTIDVPLGSDPKMGAGVVKRLQGEAIAEAISADNPQLPKQDIIDFFATYGLSHTEGEKEGEDFSEPDYFTNPLDPTSGKSTQYNLTQRGLNQIEAFSKERQKGQQSFEQAKSGYLAQGEDEYIATIKAQKDSGMVAPEEADRMIESYSTDKENVRQQLADKKLDDAMVRYSDGTFPGQGLISKAITTVAGDDVPVSDAEVSAEMARRQEEANKPENRRMQSTAQAMAKSVEPYGLPGKAFAGFFGGGGGSLLTQAAGVVRPFSSIPGISDAYQYLKETGQEGLMASQMSKGTTTAEKATHFISEAAGNVVVLIGESRIPGLSSGPALFAFSNAASASGSGKNLGEIASSGTEGYMIGKVFDGATVLGKTVSTPIERSKLLAAAVGTGTEIATIGTGTILVSKAFGKTNDEALDSAANNILFHLAMTHGSTVAEGIKKMTGRVYRIWNNGKHGDYTVTPEGGIEGLKTVDQLLVEMEAVSDPENPVYGKSAPVPETQAALDAQKAAAQDPSQTIRIAVMHPDLDTAPQIDRKTTWRIINPDTHVAIDVEKAGWKDKSKELGLKNTKDSLVQYTNVGRNETAVQYLLRRPASAVVDSTEATPGRVAVEAQVDGKQVDATVVDSPIAAKETHESMTEQYPGADVQVKPADEVIVNRVADHTTEESAPDFTDDKNTQSLWGRYRIAEQEYTNNPTSGKQGVVTRAFNKFHDRLKENHGIGVTPDVSSSLDELTGNSRSPSSDIPHPETATAHDAATSTLNDLPEPTQEQKETGSYKKGHLDINGIKIAVENPVGSERSGTDRDGKDWSIEMKSHYGEINHTVGADTEKVDVFVKDGTPKDFDGNVYVVDQHHPDTDAFDEHKVILGASSTEEAISMYKENYAEDWDGGKNITEMPMDKFKEWVRDGSKTTQAAEDFGSSESPEAEKTDVARATIAKGDTVYLKSGTEGEVLRVTGDKALVQYFDKDGEIKGDPVEIATSSLSHENPRSGEEGAISVDLLTGGVRPFVQEDVLPALKTIVDTLVTSRDDLKKVAFPANRGNIAEQTANLMRGLMGLARHNFDIATKALWDTRRYLAKRPVTEQHVFIAAIESGNITGMSLEEAGMAREIRRILDEARDRVIDLNTGALQTFYENYFPHVWKSPNAGSVIAGIVGKKPFEGSKTFLRRRTYNTFADGLAAGLVPEFDNPVDFVLFKVKEMERFVLARTALESMKGPGLAVFARNRGAVPDSFVPINDRIADVRYQNEAGEIVEVGKWYAQEQAAQIINNHLSPGLRDSGRVFSKLFKGWRFSANLLNQAQLGLSAFHLGFTSLDATISKGALGLYQLANGSPIEAVKSVIGIPTAAFTTAVRGNRVYNEWNSPMTTDLITQKVTAMMERAGGSAKMDDFFHTRMARKFLDNLQSGNLLGAAIRSPLALVDATAMPIMDYVVPRQKLGVFYDIMRFEAKRLGPGATQEQLQQAAVKAWDSVDNRMGQLVYDNLFWNNALKDGAMASVRSVGWNLGTLREIGGGLKDSTPRQVYKRIVAGDPAKPWFTLRMGYVAAITPIVALTGAITQYLLTGKGPEELKDCFYPKTGNLDDHGRPERVSLPAYTKDIIAYYKHPLDTIAHKAHPLGSLIYQGISNEDFYGTQIRNSEDPFMQQLLDTAKFIGESAMPFSVKNLMKERSRKGSTSSQVLGFFGAPLAPNYVNSTDAEELLGQMQASNIPNKTKTTEEQRKIDTKVDLARVRAHGGDAYPEFSKAVEAGILSPSDWQTIVDRAKPDYVARQAKNLSKDDVEKLMKVANEKERLQLAPVLANKEAAEAAKIVTDKKKMREIDAMQTKNEGDPTLFKQLPAADQKRLQTQEDLLAVDDSLPQYKGKSNFEKVEMFKRSPIEDQAAFEPYLRRALGSLVQRSAPSKGGKAKAPLTQDERDLMVNIKTALIQYGADKLALPEAKQKELDQKGSAVRHTIAKPAPKSHH